MSSGGQYLSLIDEATLVLGSMYEGTVRPIRSQVVQDLLRNSVSNPFKHPKGLAHTHTCHIRNIQVSHVESICADESESLEGSGTCSHVRRETQTVNTRNRCAPSVLPGCCICTSTRRELESLRRGSRRNGWDGVCESGGHNRVPTK